MPLKDTADISRLKSSVRGLFSDGGTDHNKTKKYEPTLNAFEALFTKETFVLSEEDLKMINGDLQKQLVIEEFKELISDDTYPATDHRYAQPGGEEDNDENDADYYEEDVHQYEAGFDGDDDGDFLSDTLSKNIGGNLGDLSDTDFSDFEKHEYDNYTENYEKHSNQVLPESLTNPVEDSRPNRDADLLNGQTYLESDTELDNTQYLYDPPLKYKEKFLMYLLKSTPIIIGGILVLFVFTLAAEDSLKSFKSLNPFPPTPNVSPFLSHKIFLLEEDVKSLRKLETLGDQMKLFEAEFADLKDHINKLEFSVSSNSGSDSDSKVVNPVFDKLNQLEKKVDSLSKDLSQEIFDKDYLREVKSQLVKHSNLPEIEVTNHDVETKLHKLSSKFFNIANKCHVIRQLTSYPPLSQYKREKRRTSVQSRIIHGFPDFMKRMLGTGGIQESISKAKTLANIKLMSTANSPRNVLLESPTLFWQNVASAMPVYLAIQAPSPMQIHELGLYHSRLPPNFHVLDDAAKADIRKRWFNTAPKDVEFLVRPISAEQKPMKESMGSFYNQDLKFNISRKVKAETLNGWVRVGELTYDINSNRAYQPLVWSAAVKEEIAKWSISDFMIVIHTNWGDEIVVLDTLRIFQLKGDGLVEYITDQDGMHGVNDNKGIEDYGDDVIYLGEETPAF